MLDSLSGTMNVLNEHGVVNTAVDWNVGYVSPVEVGVREAVGVRGGLRLPVEVRVAVGDNVDDALLVPVAVSLAVHEGLAPYVRLLVAVGVPDGVGVTAHASTTRPGLLGRPAAPP